MSKKYLALSIVLPLALATATLILLGLVRTNLPYSQIGGRITDTLAIPGAWIVSFIYPEGVHTGRGTSASAVVWLTFFSNLIVYSLFWYACLDLLRYVLARRSKKHGESEGDKQQIA